MKVNNMKKSGMFIISLITLTLFLMAPSYAGDNKMNQTPGISTGKFLLLAKGQDYVSPPKQKNQCICYQSSCCPCDSCKKI